MRKYLRKNRRYYYPMIDLSLHRKEIEFDSPVVSSGSTILLNEVVVTGKGGKLFRDKFLGRLDSLAQADLGGNAFSLIDRQTVTYQGPIYSEEELLCMNNLWRTKGYYTAREFYQPDEVDMQLSMPDARNTLLWQPSVITDEKGEATVSFHCSDINTGFVGVVEGIDGAGLLGNGNCEFRVMRVHE